MKRNIKKITKISALLATAIIATFIIFSSNNIKETKAETTVETATFIICSGIQVTYQNQGYQESIEDFTLEEWRSKSDSYKQTYYKNNSQSFEQMTGQLQCIKIANSLQFVYYDQFNETKKTFSYFTTYQNVKGEERIALKLEKCLSQMILMQDGSYRVLQPGALSGGIIIDMSLNNTIMEGSTGYNVINFKEAYDCTPLSVYFDFKNYNCLEVRFQDFNINVYFGADFFPVSATKDNIRGRPIRGYRMQTSILALNQAATNQAYDNGYNQGIIEKTQYGEQKYQEGYTKGVESANVNTFDRLLISVVDVPLKTLYGIFNVEILGTNLYDFVTALFSLLIVIKIIQLAGV